MGLLRLALRREAPPLVVRPLCGALTGVIRESDGAAVVWSRNLSIIAALCSIGMFGGNWEAAPKMGHFMLSVAVACINMGLATEHGGWWGRCKKLLAMGDLERLLLGWLSEINGCCDISCGTFWIFELCSCDRRFLESWRRGHHGETPVRGVNTVRSGTHKLCTGELYGEAWLLGGGVEAFGGKTTSCRLGPLKCARRCWQVLRVFNPSCFTSGTV